MRFTRFFGRALTIVMLTFASKAMASPIVGSMSMTGFDQNRVMAGSPPVVVGLDFSADPSFTVGSLSGDFASLAGQSGSIANFMFASLPATPIWSIGGFSFYATSIEDINASVALGNPLSFNAHGYMTGPGFDPTPGVWSYTGNDRGRTAAWSASIEQIAIPEPAAFLLLGGGLIALGLARRRPFLKESN